MHNLKFAEHGAKLHKILYNVYMYSLWLIFQTKENKDMSSGNHRIHEHSEKMKHR